jgi:hypothetical protein
VEIAKPDGTAWTKVVGTSTCSKDDFQITPQVVTQTSIPASPGSVTVTAAKIKMLDRVAVNQDACKTADVPLYITAS